MHPDQWLIRSKSENFGLANRRHRPLVVSTDGQNRPKAPVSQKGRILRGWRRGGRIGVKSLEIASQNSFSIPFSQTRLQASFEGRVAPFLRQRLLSPLKSRSWQPITGDPRTTGV